MSVHTCQCRCVPHVEDHCRNGEPDFPPEVIEKATDAVPLYLMTNGRDTQRRVAEAVLAAVADHLYQRGFTEGGEEALTSALHPEFGTEWREPDGIIWKEYHRGMVEGARRVHSVVQLARSWGRARVDASKALASIEEGGDND